MSDEYINRNELLNVISTNVAEKHNERCSQLLEAILLAPTADVVEVVRCKDCKCFILNMCGKSNGLTGADKMDFCSYGERRTDNDL